MPVMSRGRRNQPSSFSLCPRNYTSIQGLPYRKGHFPIIPQSVRPLLSTLMDQMDRRLAPSALQPPTLNFISCSFFFLSLPSPLRLFLSLCLCLSTSLNPVFSILATLSINHLSDRCDVPWPCWGGLWCDLDSSWFSCRVILCMSVPLSVAHNSDTASFPASPELFILFSCERMELSRCITDFSFSGQAYCFPWPPHLKSVETGLFFHVYKWALFMNPWGNACLLFEGI